MSYKIPEDDTDVKKYHHGQCIFDDINLCQKPGSGGHSGTIMSVDKIYCAKKVDLSDDNLEVRFINNQYNQDFLKGYIPKFNGICDLRDKKYIMIENLKHDYAKPIVLDIKIGFKTANKEILDLINYKKNKAYKLFKQSYIDNHSTSTKYGYRAEGYEGSDGEKKVSKSKLKSMKPEKTFGMYFSKDYYNVALKGMVQTLRQFYDIIMTPEFNPYVLTGSSLLFIYDANEPERNAVKMIDFSNSYVYTQNTTSPYNATFVDSYRKAIRNLIGDLVIFLGNKEFKSDKVIRKVMPLAGTLKINKSKRVSQNVSSQKKTKSYKSMNNNFNNNFTTIPNRLSSKSIKKTFRQPSSTRRVSRKSFRL
jgi:hypothetical protein